MLTIRLAVCGAIVLLMSGNGGTARSQPAAGQAQPPTFRSTTALVEVDAIILDRQGRFVPGLTADDLELREDGKLQQIQQFYLITHQRALRSDLPDPATIAGAHNADRRLFVILFDEGHLATESLLRVKVGAEDFIRDQLGPGDVAGVFVDGGMFRGRLTSDKAELVSGVRAVRPAFDNRQGLLAPFREFPRIPTEVDAVRIADGARELVDDLGNKACNEDPISCSAAGGVQQVENVLQRKAKFYVSQARVLTSQTLQNLRLVIRGLSRFPGRKTVVFLTEGFFVEESRSVLESISAAAARAGVTIYSIDGRGNANTMGASPDVVRKERARSTGMDTGADGPNILTDRTGGLMIGGIDDMSRAFGMIVRDTSTYYVIGYSPTNATLDGKFRKIQLKSKTGLKVRSRLGYAATALPPQDALWNIR